MRKLLQYAPNPFKNVPYKSYGRVAQNVRSVGSSTPAPVGGWDAISPIAQMDPKRAVRLDNWFPQPDWVELRKGFRRHGDLRTALPVETLMAYQGTSTRKLFGVSDGEIYDITGGGSPSPSVVGLSNSRFQYTNFGTTGGNFLYIVNGADTPRYFDGSSWNTATITGADATQFASVAVFKNRLLFTFNNSTKFAYLPVDSIQGAASTFEMGGIFDLGGHLQAIATWTLDGGNGPDDYAAFVTSRGQVAIYTGADPGDANNWSLVGVFGMGPPVGRRCITKVGGDVAIICIDGVVPLSRALIFDRAAVSQVIITQNIQRVVNQSIRNYGDNFGWQIISYPRGTRAILNVPIVEGVLQHQYVMNTISGAWCRFTGMNANCWELLGDRIFFGGNDGRVYEADVGGTDYGGVLSADMMTSFNYYGARGQQKRFTMCRPLLTTDAQVNPGIALNVNFQTNAPISVPSLTTAKQPALWDSAIWDESMWAGETETTSAWTTVGGIGFCSSIRMVVEVGADATPGVWGVGLWGVATWGFLDGPAVTLQVNGFDMVMERGGFL